MTITPHFKGQATLRELFTVVYVRVDDYLKRSVEMDRFSLPRAANEEGSYAELMTIALVDEWRSQDHSGVWFDLVKVENNLSAFLPTSHSYLQDQTRFTSSTSNRTLFVRGSLETSPSHN